MFIVDFCNFFLDKGYGAYYYSATHFYEGEWYAGKKSGWGRMYYDNGDIYEGEWQDDMRSGQGMLRLSGFINSVIHLCLSPFCILVFFGLANNNRYEGEWKRDKKNGNGKFFFLNKGNLIEGFWVDDVCKASQVIDFDREHAIDPTKYKLPAVCTYQF